MKYKDLVSSIWNRFPRCGQETAEIQVAEPLAEHFKLVVKKKLTGGRILPVTELVILSKERDRSLKENGPGGPQNPEGELQTRGEHGPEETDMGIGSLAGRLHLPGHVNIKKMQPEGQSLGKPFRHATFPISLDLLFEQGPGLPLIEKPMYGKVRKGMALLEGKGQGRPLSEGGERENK